MQDNERGQNHSTSLRSSLEKCSCILVDPGGHLAMVPHPVCQWDVDPQPVKNFVWADGYWVVLGKC